MYRHEEGMWARVPSAIVGGIITVAATRAAMRFGAGLTPYVWAGIVFAALSVTTLYFAFVHRKTVDVLVDTENEMRKVVWPTKDEVSGSTVVVISTVLLLGAAVFLMDVVLAHLLSLIRLYKL